MFTAAVALFVLTCVLSHIASSLCTCSFAFLDKHLEGKKFFCGDRCTLADIRIFCNYKFYNKMAAAKGFTIDPKYKNLCAWLANCEATAGGEAVKPAE